jgi:hypothetical protein
MAGQVSPRRPGKTWGVLKKSYQLEFGPQCRNGFMVRAFSWRRSPAGIQNPEPDGLSEPRRGDTAPPSDRCRQLPRQGRPPRLFRLRSGHRPLEHDADPVVHDPNERAISDHTILFGHQLKSTWNIGWIWNNDGGAVVGDVDYLTARARATARDVRGLFDLGPRRFPSIFHHSVGRQNNTPMRRFLRHTTLQE